MMQPLQLSSTSSRDRPLTAPAEQRRFRKYCQSSAARCQLMCPWAFSQEFDVVSATMKGLVLKTMMNRHPEAQLVVPVHVWPSDTCTHQCSFSGVPPEGFPLAAAPGCDDCAHYEIDMYKTINSSRMDEHTRTGVSVPPPSDPTGALGDLVSLSPLCTRSECPREVPRRRRREAAQPRARHGELVRAAQAAFPDADDFRRCVRVRERRLRFAVAARDGRVIEVAGQPLRWLRLVWGIWRAVRCVVGPHGRGGG